MNENENLFQDSRPEERPALLEANACRVEDESVKRYFTEEELSDKPFFTKTTI